MFEPLQPASPDKILGLMDALRADPRPGKVDLGVGVYRDVEGRTPVLAAVRAAERRLWESQSSKAYLGLEGDLGFNAAMARLVLGHAVPPVRTRACQAAGGSGALRILGDLLFRANPRATLWLPEPTWPNHHPLMRAAGFRVATYPYYDVPSGTLRFDEMRAALGKAASGDIVLLHGCCHNPSGADLDLGQWQALGEVLAQRGLFPFVDLAYQGFGDGLELDAGGVRLLAAMLPELAVAVSCSKNFGLYRDRVGCAVIVAEDARRADVVLSQLTNVVRAGHSMAPGHGAAVVRMILDDEALARSWRQELEGMCARINTMRTALAAALRQRTNSDAYDGLARQRGLFSLLDVTPAQVDELRHVHGIYMVDNGRLNIAGLTVPQVDTVADAIAQVCGAGAAPALRRAESAA